MASFQQQPQLAAKGVAEMNRAVELAPNSARVRLVAPSMASAFRTRCATTSPKPKTWTS